MKFAFVTCVQIGLSCMEAIYDLNGKSLLKGNTRNNDKVNISSLENGSYFIKISDNENNKVIKFNKI